MAECSICSKGEETARIVNELLERKTPVREIQVQTGIHKNTVHRHQHGNCRFSFSKFKAAKLKSRSSVNLNGREVVQWPGPNGPTFTTCIIDVRGKTKCEPVGADQLRPDDILLVVEYADPLPARPPLPAPEPIADSPRLVN
jgi:hypothetical protein